MMLKLLQEIRGFAEVTNRRPQSRSTGMFLMQIRSHLTHTTVPCHKCSILVHGKDRADVPHPVKITYMARTPLERPSRPARPAGG